MKLGYRHDHRVGRVDGAARDGLQGLHQRSPGGDGIDAQMRHRGMGAMAADLDVEAIGAGHHRSVVHRERTRWQAGPVVHPVNRFHWKAFQQAVLDHLAAAAIALLRRLKNEMDGAVEIAMLRQMRGCAQEHRGVAVVAAGMHPPGIRE